MNREQFDAVSSAPEGTAIITADHVPGPDRTLVYGYDVDRNTFHVYLLDGQIHLVVYDYSKTVLTSESAYSFEAARLVPSKRAYPERTDYLFAQRMLGLGAPLCFTRFDANRASAAAFHGLLADQL